MILTLCAYEGRPRLLPWGGGRREAGTEGVRSAGTWALWAERRDMVAGGPLRSVRRIFFLERIRMYMYIYYPSFDKKTSRPCDPDLYLTLPVPGARTNHARRSRTQTADNSPPRHPSDHFQPKSRPIPPTDQRISRNRPGKHNRHITQKQNSGWYNIHAHHQRIANTKHEIAKQPENKIAL